MAAAARGPLARRLRMLVGESMSARAGLTSTLLAAAGIVPVLAVGLLLPACIGTPRTSAAEVEEIGQRIRARSGFPIIADARIAEALNRRLNDPAWRDGVKAALARAPQYLPTIDAHLQKAGVPVELRAMVLTESRFDPQARTSRPPERRSVGIWQLMPATARRLGLTVTAEQDERLDPGLASAAAARLLAQDFQHFGNWPLAIAAYNGGRAAIEKLRNGRSVTETQDELLASNAEYGRYLTSVMISMLVMEDPNLLE